MSLLFDLVKQYNGDSTDKADSSLYAKRISTCNNCPFLVKGTRSCGTIFKGGTVDYNGQKKELCGCRIDDKAKYKEDHCPLGKW